MVLDFKTLAAKEKKNYVADSCLWPWVYSVSSPSYVYHLLTIFTLWLGFLFLFKKNIFDKSLLSQEEPWQWLLHSTQIHIFEWRLLFKVKVMFLVICVHEKKLQGRSLVFVGGDSWQCFFANGCKIVKRWCNLFLLVPPWQCFRKIILGRV